MPGVLHVLDHIAHAVMRVPSLVPRSFSDGWGDENLLERFAHDRRHPPAPPELDIGWTEAPSGLGLERPTSARLGEFYSPVDHLPAPGRAGRVLWVGSDHQRQVLLMAASNDHDWSTRAAVATHLDRLQIGAMILENPFYGRRRTAWPHALATVADFFRMGSGATIEGLGILRHLRARGHALGVAGFSQGGAIAAYISAIAPFDVATTAMAAGPSPAPVFTRDIMATTVDWNALGGLEAGRGRLHELLSDVTVARYRPAPHHAAAVVAGGRRDAYVAASDVEALAAHWDGSELVWLDGGHASFHLYGKATQAELIRRAFDRLDHQRQVR
jgi:hypothetical protein